MNKFASRVRSWITPMTAFGLLRFSSRRTILVYLFAIVGPTVVLLYLGLESVQRQREAITSLTLSNLRLSGDKLAAELEWRASQLAEACLRDDALMRLPLDSEGNTPQAVRQIRAALAGARERHPIVRCFFIWENDVVRFPLLHTPLPERLSEFLAHDNAGAAQEFATSFNEGETLELQQEKPQPELALAKYRKCAELNVPDAFKALALARVARCLPKVNQVEEAESVYGSLLDKYGDCYDLSHRPYALVAALELGDLFQSRSARPPPLLVAVYRDFVQGRWEVSAEQVEYFINRFHELWKESEWRVTPKSDWQNQFDVARALEASFRHAGSLQTNEVHAAELKRGEISYQTFYVLHPLGGHRQTLFGFAADLDWIDRELLPQARRDLELGELFRLAPRPQSPGQSASDASELRIGFQKLFPFWELSSVAASGLASRTAARRDELIFAGVVLFILSVLVLGVVLLLRDLSREMQVNRLRSDFVSGVSHELKTPLTLIRLYGETLLYGENFPDEERRNYYQIITRESERLTHLIEKVLDFSRIDRGQKEYHLREGDLSVVVANTVEVYKQYLKRQGFELETDVATELPPVRFDSDAVSEAVLNLIDNAAKYSGSSRLIHVRLRLNGSEVGFEVQDFGVGIGEAERGKIFQQFYRGSTRKEKGGYGLGLFLVKHIMDAHGGRVEVESEVGKGSVFRLLFPVVVSGHCSGQPRMHANARE